MPKFKLYLSAPHPHLTTLDEAYKVMQLQQQKLSPLEGFYQLTLGGAEALSLQDKIGNFDRGKEADFVVLNWAPRPIYKSYA